MQPTSRPQAAFFLEQDMQLIYTEKTEGFEEGKHYRNPVYFDRIESEATSVVLDGNYPHIAKAYQDAGIDVTDIKGKATLKPKAEAE